MTPDTRREALEQIEDALYDLAGGLKYVRERYGDLNGVGFDRALGKYEPAVKLLRALTPQPASGEVDFARANQALKHLVNETDYRPDNGPRIKAAYDIVYQALDAAEKALRPPSQPALDEGVIASLDDAISTMDTAIFLDMGAHKTRVTIHKTRADQVLKCLQSVRDLLKRGR